MSSEQNFKKSKVAKVAKKGLFRIVFSRTGIMLLLILIQLGIFIMIPYYLTATMGCNPNYADSSLSQGLSVGQMREFFNWMPEMERIRFNPENVLKFLGKK